VKRKGGRPRVCATPEQVRGLRDGQGLSLRRVGHVLGISKSSVERLYNGAPAPGVSLNPGTASQNPRSDVPDHYHGTQPPQATGERWQVREIHEADTPAPIAELGVAIYRLPRRRIEPKRNSALGVRPVDGRSPHHCPNCGSQVWRLRSDGTLQCSICHRLQA
jgi:hypothetical protein